jgi:muramoyltetrapeptide carboxypeptidase
VKGRRLAPGGTIAVLSPAPPSHAAGAEWVEEGGFRPVLLAADPSGLHEAFTSPEIDAVVWRGDSGGELLRRLDYRIFAESPKPFLAPADATALLTALASAARLVAFLGPAPARLDAAAHASLRDALGSECPAGALAPSGRSLVPGFAEGELVGGSAAQLCSLLGTPWEPDTRGKILVLAAPRGAPWRIRPHLVHLLNAGKLQAAGGLVLTGLGGPGAIDEVVEQLVLPLELPTVADLPLATHGPALTIPLGVHARLDGYDGRLELLEAGVTA